MGKQIDKDNSKALIDLLKEDSNKSSNSGKTEVGEDPVKTRIGNLEEALKGAKEAVTSACKGNIVAIVIASILCCTVVIVGCLFCIKLYKDADLIPDEWTWQIIYLTAIRLTICAALFSLASFCFKLLRSYLHIYQINKHRKVVIKSMASLVEAARPETRNAIFHRLLDIIIKFSNTGFLSKEKDFKAENISDTVAKIADKKLKE